MSKQPEQETIRQTRGIERRYDASWHTVLNMLKALNERNFISPDIASTAPGQIALVKGRIQVLDLRMIQEMWDTLLDWHISQMPSATSAHRREKEKMKSDFRLAAQIIKNSRTAYICVFLTMKWKRGQA